MKRLLYIFESKYATAFCIIFAIANRIIFATLYSTIGRDARMQITYAKNFLAGKGLGVTKYFTANLNDPVFDTTQHFPPGFSFVIIPFIKLFKNDEYSAVLAFDIVTIFFFVFAARMLARAGGLPLAFRNILTLIVGCSQYPFIMSGSSTDLVGLTIILFGITFLIKITDPGGQLKPTTLFLYSLVFFLPSFFRYMYIPVSLLFPVIIILLGVYTGNKAVRSLGLRSGLYVLSLTFFLLFLSYKLSGNSVYVYDAGRGIFFNQLVHWYPYIPASFINLDFIAQLIARVAGISYTNVFKIFEVLNTILLAFLSFLLLRYLLSLKRIQLNKSSVLILSGTAICLCVLFVITYFSLTYKPQLYGIYLWNYNYESRYFAFIYIFLPVMLLLCVSVYSSLLKNIIFKGIIFTGLFLLFVEVIHGVYYNVKIVKREKDVMAIKDRVADYKQFPEIVKELTEKYPQHELLITASDQVFLQSASQMGYKAIFDYTNLNTVSLKVSKKSLLLFPVHETDEWLMKEYLQKRKPRLLTKMAGTLFYIEEINP